MKISYACVYIYTEREREIWGERDTTHLSVGVDDEGRALPVVRAEEGEEGHQPVQHRAGGLWWRCVLCVLNWVAI